MSAVAALAVASPLAVTVVSESWGHLPLAGDKPAPQQHEFVPAGVISDLPGEIMSALQSSLSQFGIVVPNMSSITGPSSTPASTGFMPGGLPATSGMTAATPGLPTTANSLAPPNFADPSLANPTLNQLAQPAPALPPSTPTPPTPTVPGLSTTPTASVPPASGATSAVTPATGPNPAVTPATGLSSAPPPATGATSALSPSGAIPAPGEFPITTGADPYANMYPVLGGPLPPVDPSLGMPMTTAAPSGGLLSEAFSQLGGTQAIDLLKGVVVPSIVQAIKSAAPVPGAAPPPVPAPPPTP